MKIQYLSIIFIIIILPVILITSVYNRMQINTIQMQRDYDDKLITASYDAIRAFQINTENNEYSSISDSKRRDIEAAVETFVTSLSTGLGVGGYGTSYLKPYIPAMLFTLYDGYYIYAPTENGDKIEHTLKPFVAYSQRYVHGNIDVVINYTLDNYVSIYGKIGTEYVRKAGYLNYFLLNEDVPQEKEILSENLFIIKETFAPYTKNFNFSTDEDGKTVFYDAEKGLWFAYSGNQMIQYLNTTYDTVLGNATLTISGIDYGFDSSRIDENDYVSAFIKEYNYYYDGKQKVYYDSSQRKCFTYLDATKRIQPQENINYTGDSSYYNYAKESKEFTQWVVDNLSNLTISNARGEGNTAIQMFEHDTAKFLDFNEHNKPEEANTLFNTHKREVIKLSVEKNLMSAINNYDKHSVALDATYSFKMPVITEIEWDRILTNVSLVTFLQGLPVGFKTYNNYVVVTSSTNEEYVTDDTIYFLNPGENTYHRIGCEELDMSQTVVGYRNSDFERFKVTVSSSDGSPEQMVYYYRQERLPCYYCVVNRLAQRVRNIFDQNSDDYIWEQAEARRNAYYKAIGRERYNVVN